MSVLFFGKRGDYRCERAQEFVSSSFGTAIVVTGTRHDRFPEEYVSWSGDYVFSYLCPWVIPEALLSRARRACLNFHPGPPEYPGIGCTNFAIYNGETTFGVTCHHMAGRVDSGAIVAVRRFPLLLTDTVYSLTQRCYDHIDELFGEVVSEIVRGRPLPKSQETWTRRPYTRKELNALCRIEPDMTAEEVRRRVRAVTFPGAPGAYLEIAGLRFEHQASEEGHQRKSASHQ